MGGGNLKNNSKAKGRKNGRKKGAQRENERKRKRKLKGTRKERAEACRACRGRRRPFQDDGSPSVALGRRLTRVSGESQAHPGKGLATALPCQVGPASARPEGRWQGGRELGQVPRRLPLCARTDAWGSCLRRACCFNAALPCPPVPLQLCSIWAISTASEFSVLRRSYFLAFVPGARFHAPPRVTVGCVYILMCRGLRTHGFQ